MTNPAGDQTGNQGTADQQQQGSAPDGNAGGTTSTATDSFKPPASQADFDRIIAERVARVEAKYKDAPEARQKAAEYDKLVEAQKTELQKIQDRAEAAEKRAAELETAEQKRVADAEQAKQIADWKTEVAQETGVPANALRGSTKEDLQAHAEEIKALLPDPNARKGGGAYVPAEGRQQAGSGSADPRQVFAEILKNA